MTRLASVCTFLTVALLAASCGDDGSVLDEAGPVTVTVVAHDSFAVEPSLLEDFADIGLVYPKNWKIFYSQFRIDFRIFTKSLIKIIAVIRISNINNLRKRYIMSTKIFRHKM